MDHKVILQGNFNDYICGGYFIVKVASNSGSVEFCDICKAKLPPGDIITLSTCLTTTLPHAWALEWVKTSDEDRIERGSKWGLSGRELKDFIEWTTAKFSTGEFAYPNAIFELETATELLQKFAIKRNGWNLLGLGLRTENVE